MSSKISQDDLINLLDTLITAIDTGNNQEFIQIMTENKNNFDMKIDSYLAKGNTLNHSIARAVDDNYCSENQINDCDKCIGENDEFTMPATPISKKIIIPYGKKPFKISQFIRKHPDVLKEYKNLFKESYKTIVNNKGRTPNYFAEKCNIDLYKYMNDVNIQPENSNNTIDKPLIQDIQDNNNINRIEGDEEEDIKTKYNINRIKDDIKTIYGTSYVNFGILGAGKRKRKSRKSIKTKKSRKTKKTRKSSQKKKRSHRR